MYLIKNSTKLLLAALMVLSVSCGTSNHTKKNPEDMNLSDYISQLSGVRVNGSGEYTTVMVSSQKMSGKRFAQGWSGKATGGESSSRENPPLFIVNGQKIGRDYQKIRDMVSGKEIESVNLMSKNMAYSQYRKESYYGVIEITTKKSGATAKN